MINKKVIITILLFIMLIFIISEPIFAFDLGGILSSGKNFINNGESQNKVDVNKIADIMKPIAGALLGIGTVVIVSVATIVGIKYMTASPDEKGKLKTQLIGLVVSAIVLYGAYGIWSMAYRFMYDITTTGIS